jgi:type I restriction enzyme S subunit
MKTNQSQKNTLLDWQEIKLSDVTTKISDGLHTTPKYVENSKYYFINGNNLFNDQILIDSYTKCVTEGEYIKHKKDLSDESILLGINGTIGNVALYNNEKVILGKSAAYINCTKKVSKKYIFNLLKTQGIQKYFEREVTGSTIKNLSIKSIKNISFICPLVPEQNRIVSVLETWDKTIEKLAQKIEVKKQIKKGLMQDLLTGKKRLSGFSDKWELVKLGKIATFKKGKGLPKSELNSNGEYEAIHYGELFTKYNEYIETVKNRTNSNKGMFMSKKNDILMPTSDVTPRGLSTASYINKDGVVLGGDILVIRSNGSLNGLFFCYLVNLNKKDVIKLVSGSTVFHLYGSDMAKFELKLPPIKEQESIVKILLTSDKEITTLQHKLSIIKDQKKYLLNNLITGEIRTPENLTMESEHIV